MKTLLANLFFFVGAILGICFPAIAATRSVLIPGRTAIILMEGFSSQGADPDPRNLYEALNTQPVQQQGGLGKVLASAGKEFSLVCVTKNTTRDSVVCNIAIKPSVGSNIQMNSAEFKATGADAKAMYETCAGKNATQPFTFESANKNLRINASSESFDFTFQE